MAPRHAAPTDPSNRVRTALAVAAVVSVFGIAGASALIPNTILTPPAGAATHGALRVDSVSPSGRGVAADTPLVVRFNNPLAVDSPTPVVMPNVAGSWVRLSPEVLAFHASASFGPGTKYTVLVPGATRATDGTMLGQAVTRSFVMVPGSMLRLNQILAELGYLPVRFVPTGSFDPGSAAVQPGVFEWRWASVPTELTSLWAPDAFTVITEGALMRFEDVHGLTTAEAAPTAALWRSLLRAVAKGETDPDPYNYVVVNQAIPETLSLYQNMKVIYTTPVNTGISVRPTAIATNPVYVRYTVTTMSGTNPDGTKYDDPGIPWVSYFNGGEALHGYIRSSYGWPQSLGCVEMPFSNAQVVWPHTPIGTLVTVTAP
jgi:hypothetical protein